jgi:hypothetical protein
MKKVGISKKLMVLCVIAGLAVALAGLGCKRSGVDPNLVKDLKYENNGVVANETETSCIGYVELKSKNARVMFFGIRDAKSMQYLTDEIKALPDKINSKYPVKAYKDSSGSAEVQVLINERLIASISYAAGGPAEFNDPDRLKQLVPLFDLDGLAGISLPSDKEVDGKTLGRFLPKLD